MSKVGLDISAVLIIFKYLLESPTSKECIYKGESIRRMWNYYDRYRKYIPRKEYLSQSEEM